MKDQTYDPVAAALRLLCQTDDQFKIDVGFRELKDLADAGDMTAAAHFGYASQFEHLGHYDLDACRELKVAGLTLHSNRQTSEYRFFPYLESLTKLR